MAPAEPGSIYGLSLIHIYMKKNGEVPVEQFLDSVNPKMRAKIFGLLGILPVSYTHLYEKYQCHYGNRRQSTMGTKYDNRCYS